MYIIYQNNGNTFISSSDLHFGPLLPVFFSPVHIKTVCIYAYERQRRAGFYMTVAVCLTILSVPLPVLAVGSLALDVQGGCTQAWFPQQHLCDMLLWKHCCNRLLAFNACCSPALQYISD